LLFSIKPPGEKLSDWKGVIFPGRGGLSDPGMEEALIEIPTMRRFAGIDLISDRIPDETTILTFRHLLEENELGELIHCFAGFRLRDGEKPSQGARHGHEARHDH
jgi:hypothetical protein